IGMEQRRALAVERFLLRIGADQPVEIAGFELVRVARQRRDVADAVIAGAAAEEVVEYQRGKRGVAAGAAAADDDALGGDEPASDEEAGAVEAVVDVDDAPVAMQPVAIGAAEAAAAAVVDVKHRDAAARPVLGGETEAARCRRGRAAMALHQQR